MTPSPYLSHGTDISRTPPVALSRPSTSPQSTAMSRLRTLLRAAPLLTAILGGTGVMAEGCGNVDIEGQNSCDPTPSCGNLDVSIAGFPSPDTIQYYVASGRWERQNPVTGAVTEVCDPADRKFCAEGQTPENDSCTEPVCANAKACDPVPGLVVQGAAGRYPYQANFPTTSTSSAFVEQILQDQGHFPIIFDNTPDCNGGEPTMGESYLTCDPIPECDKVGKPMIPYCDPLPRCNAGESPIVCDNTKAFGFENQVDCQNQFQDQELFWGQYRIDLNPAIQGGFFCQPETDPETLKTVYKFPEMSIICLPTPECQAGEIPMNTNLNVPVTCVSAQWMSSQQGASCDPIKSCH